MKRATDEIDSYLRTTVGDIGSVLTESYSKAFSYLSHSKPEIRSAAILACQIKWSKEISREFVEECLRMATLDLDNAVRVAAATALGECKKNSRDPEMSRGLAAIASDLNQSLWLRYTAFIALRKVRGAFGMNDIRRQLLAFDKILRESGHNSDREKRIGAECSHFKTSVDTPWDDVEAAIDEQFVRQFL